MKRGFGDRLRIGCFLSVLLIAMLFLSQSALADELILEHTALIPEDDHYATSFDAKFGETIEIEFRSDRVVDLIMTSEDGYFDYTNPSEESFEYYVDGSTFITTLESISFPVPEDRKYYIIVDNSEVPMSGASPSGTANITIEITRTGEPFNWSICIGITVLILVIIVVTIALVLSRRKKEKVSEYDASLIYQQTEMARPMNCPSCGTYSTSGSNCTKCGRRLR
ncbi:MAG: hypothetical protein KAW09_02695 [Thermoplasmata archaeon]|nr:hypothetical protein [Thermoplasmata archaeon]